MKRVVKVPSKRGGIFDRNGKEFAVSIEVDSVFARPSEVENSRLASSAISKVIEVEPVALKRSLDSQKALHMDKKGRLTSQAIRGRS